MVLQVMADAARIASPLAAMMMRKPENEKMALAVFNCLGVFQQGRIEGAEKHITILQFLGVFLENGGGLVGQRRSQ